MKDIKRLAEHFIKQRDEVFADWIKKTLLKLLAHLDTSNQHNCNKIWAILSLLTEFITEFESSWAITVYLNNYYTNQMH